MPNWKTEEKNTYGLELLDRTYEEVLAYVENDGPPADHPAKILGLGPLEVFNFVMGKTPHLVEPPGSHKNMTEEDFTEYTAGLMLMGIITGATYTVRSLKGFDEPPKA